MRFQIFLNIKEQLQEFDYIFFLNANMLPVAPVGDEILPTEEQGLMVMIHSFFYQKDRSEFTYETNPASTAYIPPDQGKYYFRGSFNGGISHVFLQAYSQMLDNTLTDLNNNIIAIWHDESHLNKYVLDKNPLILPPEYGCCEGEVLPRPLKAKAILLDKAKPKYGGLAYLRGITNKKRGYIGYYLDETPKIIFKTARNIIPKKIRNNIPQKIKNIIRYLLRQ